MASHRMSRISLPSIAEAGLPVLVAAGFVVGSALLADARTLGPVGYGVLMVGAAALLVRRSHPIAALAGTVIPAFGYDLLNFPGGLCTIAVGVALYAVADAGHLRTGIGTIDAEIGGFLGIAVSLQPRPGLHLVTTP